MKIKVRESKKNEADYGAMTWTVTVEFDDNGKSVRKDYVVKAHNRDSAIDQAKLKPQHTNPDAKNIKVAYCKLGESLVKKTEAAGDSPKKIYRIKSLSTDVYEDDWEDGEGEHVNYWSGSDVLGRKMYKEFSSLGDILRMLNDEYLYIWKDADNIKNWAIFDDPDLKDEIRFDCDTMVDVDNNVADESDLKAWKNGRKKLFNAHSVLYVTAEYTTYASAAELTEDAKKIGLDTI